MPVLYNKNRDNVPTNAVDITRNGPFGNPFIIGKDGTRKEVVEKFRIFFYNNPQLMAKARQELQGKDLVCHCTPKLCHGEIYLHYANEDTIGFE